LYFKSCAASAASPTTPKTGEVYTNHQKTSAMMVQPNGWPTHR
jgi:hypothetical protein